jgi:hypothetical protein
MRDVGIAIHVLSIYLGALACSWLRVYHHGRILRREDEERMMDLKEGVGWRYASYSALAVDDLARTEAPPPIDGGDALATDAPVSRIPPRR